MEVGAARACVLLLRSACLTANHGGQKCKGSFIGQKPPCVASVRQICTCWQPREPQLLPICCFVLLFLGCCLPNLELWGI